MQDRHLLIAYDTTIGLDQLGYLFAQQTFINKSFIPYLESLYPDYNFPRTIHFVLVGPTNKLSFSHRRDILEFNLSLLKNTLGCEDSQLDLASYLILDEKS